MTARRPRVTVEGVVLGSLMKHPAMITPVIGTTNKLRIAASADASKVANAMTHVAWYELFMSARGRPVS